MPDHQDEVVRRLKQIHLKSLDDGTDEDDYLYPINHNIAEIICLTFGNLLFMIILLPIYLCICFFTNEPNQAIVL